MKRACSFVVLAIAVVVAAGLAGRARADGLPVLGVDVGGSGVASSAGDARYVTLPARRGTVVARVSSVGGRVLGSRPLAVRPARHRRADTNATKAISSGTARSNRANTAPREPAANLSPAMAAR